MNYNVRGGEIHHLRSQGALLYKRSTPQHLTLVATKGNVQEIPFDRVVESFGTAKWPHLLHDFNVGDNDHKQRVLNAMISVFKNPQDLAMCLKLGVMDHIEHGILSDNNLIQELSSNVLYVILETSIGRDGFMKSGVASTIANVFRSASNLSSTRHLYDGFLALTRSCIGAQLLTQHGYLDIVISHLKRKLGGDLRARVLQLLKNLINDGVEETVLKAIELEGVELCAKHLYDRDSTTRVAACEALASLSYVDQAKKIAVACDVVKKLCILLNDSQWQVTAASAGALMCLAVNDEAKRIIVSCEGLHTVNQLLLSPKYLVQLNTVKLISAIVSNPTARKYLNVPSTEYHLKALATDSNELLAKSARLALEAVQWQP